ncbi:hypothetical protein [Heyndrickxia acidicola]|uniref:Uncharacterized protein n=1 Tax=Heyndrickxia acidicola TaxID=209389 RepID=A0ABU6MD11_9BACI|nr:hypothetical protein [Heyndrickxia acidicola]MED1202556.1 hypothetical protein [Heyndrickxia acidicola]
MLFTPVFFIGAGSIMTIAMLDKLAEAHGWESLSFALKLALPIAGIVAAALFLDSSAVMRFLR